MNKDAPPARGPRMRLEELLLRHGALSQAQLDEALEEQKRTRGELGRVLVDLGFVSEPLLMKAYAHQLGIPVSEPDTAPLRPEVATALGRQVCERYGVIAVDGDLGRKVLRVATSRPTNIQDLDAVAKTSGCRIEPAAATAESIKRAIRKYFHGEQLGADPESDAFEIERGNPAMHAPTRPPMAARVEPDDLEALSARLIAVEAMVRPLQASVNTTPQYTSLLARVEVVEQIAANTARDLRLLTELLLETGVLSREAARAKFSRRGP